MSDEENGNGERRQFFTVQTRWFTVRIGGNVIFGLTFGLICAMAFGIWYHDQSVRAAMVGVTAELNKLSEHQQETTAAQNELNYITVLTPAEREHIKKYLQMPETLRQKMRRRYEDERP